LAAKVAGIATKIVPFLQNKNPNTQLTIGKYYLPVVDRALFRVFLKKTLKSSAGSLLFTTGSKSREIMIRRVSNWSNRYLSLKNYVMTSRRMLDIKALASF
jgi:hypothetical protein